VANPQSTAAAAVLTRAASAVAGCGPCCGPCSCAAALGRLPCRRQRALHVTCSAQVTAGALTARPAATTRQQHTTGCLEVQTTLEYCRVPSGSRIRPTVFSMPSSVKILSCAAVQPSLLDKLCRGCTGRAALTQHARRHRQHIHPTADSRQPSPWRLRLVVCAGPPVRLTPAGSTPGPLHPCTWTPAQLAGSVHKDTKRHTAACSQGGPASRASLATIGFGCVAHLFCTLVAPTHSSDFV
jgi:hypothetical protein